MPTPVPNYRIYALIHGQILPEGDIAGCRIQKMPFEEQERRGFAPMGAKFSDEMTRDHRTYVTSLPFVDPLKIRSEYVAICDLQEHDAEAALGGAVRRLENLARFLYLANAEDIFKKYGGKAGHAQTYLYQVTRIYALDNGQEIETQCDLRSSHVFLPDRPEANHWRDARTEAFLKDVMAFNDEVLRRAVAYLYKSSVGPFALHSPEKIALDHFKSIEVILRSLSKKRRFHESLEEAAGVIGLTAQEQERIKKLYEQRNAGDVAHSKDFDISERYPNQFPLPSNTDYSGAFPDSIAQIVCLKYYRYQKDLFSVEIDYDEEAPDGGTLYTINGFWETNRLGFRVKKSNQEEITRRLRTVFSNEYGVADTEIRLTQINGGGKVFIYIARHNA